MSQKDPARHPRWDHIVNIVNREREADRVVGAAQQDVRPPAPRADQPLRSRSHVWLIDDGAHAIYKFTNDGKKLVHDGRRRPMQPGNDETHFDRPTDVAWLPDGTFFVSDGYVNTRVVKFNKDGKFVLTWGQKGNEPTETRPSYMNTVHAIAIDKNRRVYISDRANSRIQVFDENGKFLDAWPNIRRPYSILLSEDQHLWVTDGITQKVLKYDLTGKLLYSWGTFGAIPGRLLGRAPVPRRQRRATCTPPTCTSAARRSSARRKARTRARWSGAYMRGTTN